MTGASHVLGLPRGADGFYVLEMLALAGWRVSVTADGNGGSRVRAQRDGELVERQGPSVAAVALQVFEEARATTRRLVCGR